MVIILDVSTPNCCNNCPCYDGMEGANDCRVTQQDVGELSCGCCCENNIAEEYDLDIYYEDQDGDICDDVL